MIKSDLSEPLSFDHNMSVNVSYGHYYYSFPTHWHNFLEIIAPLSDDYSITMGTETYPMKPSQIALIPPRTLHSIHKKHSSPNLVIQFSNLFLPQLHDFITNRHLLCTPAVFDVGGTPGFEENPLEILLRIKDIFYRETTFKELHLYELLLHFFLVVGNHNYRINNEISAQKTPQQKSYDKKFNAVSNYIKENYMSSISLEEAAAYAGFSKYHFSRIFKEYYQTSFIEYVTSLRIGKATELLENPDLSIMDIAFQSGYSSLASFNRAFKQINQCTPSQFRKMFDHTPLA